ncbi:MAG TPA: energy-coupling factor transporter transmembrane component T [Caldilineaceae bacterium]|nr:energy-coupling factor transporter transmembrane component T [Caldilineaceae bacterium]
MGSQLSLYIERDSPLHRLNPLTKLTLALCLVLVDFLGPGYWLPTLLFVAVLVPLSLWGRVGVEFLRAAVRLLLPLVAFIFVMQSLFYPGGETVLFAVWIFSVELEGVRFGYLMASRIMTMVGAFLLLLFATHPGALMADLNQRGVSPSLTYIIVSTLQIIPQMRAKANTIMDAQRARGLETGGSPLQRVRALVPLVGPLVFGSLVDVEERAIALEARAFKAKRPKTSLLEIPDSPAQRMARFALLALTALLIGVGLWR